MISDKVHGTATTFDEVSTPLRQPELVDSG
jgi:hypothetical protein